MSLLSISTASRGGSHEIDFLLGDFHKNVEAVASDPEKYEQMLVQLRKHNPRFVPIDIESNVKEAIVLGQVVAGVYAPFIHGFTSSVVKNIKAGNLSENVIAPPRDAIPIAVSLREQANMAGVEVNLFMPHLNRNILGIANNQKDGEFVADPLLDPYFEQLKKEMNGNLSLTEVETGIYGTTSLIMASEFKKRGIKTYSPLKLYGLGPNISWVHAVLTEGRTWLAEDLSQDGPIDTFMVILDSMEELGMQNAYKSPEKLMSDGEDIKPVIVPNTPDAIEISRVTNMAIAQTAVKYSEQTVQDLQELIVKIPQLVSMSCGGMPFTLKQAIPSMDSKDVHFAKIKSSGLFDYPNLIL